MVGVDHPSPEDAQQDDEDGELVANVSKLFSSVTDNVAKEAGWLVLG